MLTRLEHWREWMERCAVDRCGAQTAAALRRFGAMRFRRGVAIGLGSRFSEGALPDDRACFHLFESHCCASHARSGKRYKEWIAARGAGEPDAARFESGASLLIRTAVRAFLKQEGPAPRQVSADAVIEGTDGLTLVDLLPDEREETRADAETAEAVARACLERLTNGQRIVVLARRAGLSLGDPAVLLACGVRKSRAFRLWAEVYEALADETRQRLGDCGREFLLHTALEAAERLGAHLFFAERVEKRWPTCFKGVEGFYDA